MSVLLEIPDDIPLAARMSPDEMRRELAIALYASGRLSVGKARELAQMSLWQFRQLIASRGIPVHLNVADLDKEMATLHRLGRL